MRRRGNSVTVGVDRAGLAGMLAVVRAADALARSVDHADPALLEPHIAAAAADYHAIREEWRTPKASD